jgi:NDP-sugar pyrophosphorylase family protein
MQLVIPMAGLGKRFQDAGYAMPKPLIPVGGEAMVVGVVRRLPPASRTVLVCHPEHLAAFPMAETLARQIPGAVVVAAPGLTDGQACSVRLAAPHLDPAEPVLVAACDSTQVCDLEQFRALTQRPGVDAIAWTYRGEPQVLVRPEWYGWIQEESGRVKAVSVKKPVSGDLLGDHVITGTFWFRSAQLLISSIDALVRSGRRVNNEFYLDSVLGTLLDAGSSVAVFEVDKYIGWGTPADLENYLKWERYFAQRDRAA